MKIRNGFVSNSSSSSFIVAFDRKPETINDVKEILFNGEGKIDLCGNEYNSDHVSEIILRDINFDPTYRRIFEVMTNNDLCLDIEDEEIDKIIPEILKFSPYYNEDARKIFDVFAGHLVAYFEELEEFAEKNKGKYFCGFIFSDECGGIQSDLEHGNVFENVNFLYYNHH